MAINTYDIGDLTVVEANFSDAETPVDPTTVTLRIMAPDEMTTTWVFGTNPEVTNPTVGNYRALIKLDLSGLWHYRWESTGAGQAAEEGALRVRPSIFA